MIPTNPEIHPTGQLVAGELKILQVAEVPELLGDGTCTSNNDMRASAYAGKYDKQPGTSRKKREQRFSGTLAGHLPRRVVSLATLGCSYTQKTIHGEHGEDDAYGTTRTPCHA